MPSRYEVFGYSLCCIIQCQLLPIILQVLVYSPPRKICFEDIVLNLKLVLFAWSLMSLWNTCSTETTCQSYDDAYEKPGVTEIAIMEQNAGCLFVILKNSTSSFGCCSSLGAYSVYFQVLCSVIKPKSLIPAMLLGQRKRCNCLLCYIL